MTYQRLVHILKARSEQTGPCKRFLLACVARVRKAFPLPGRALIEARAKTRGSRGWWGERSSLHHTLLRRIFAIAPCAVRMRKSSL